MKRIKKIITAAAVIMAIMSTGFAKDSHALIGLAFKSKPVKVVGAVGAGVGLGMGLIGFSTAATTTSLGAFIVGATFMYYGLIVAGVGLVILDEKNISDIEFKAIDPNRPEYYLGFTREQVETYNSELAQLNSIRQTMIAESNDTADTSDAEALWKIYSGYLNPNTVKIAEQNAANFLQVIR
jgi:hypothetical protein